MTTIDNVNTCRSKVIFITNPIYIKKDKERCGSYDKELDHDQ